MTYLGINPILDVGMRRFFSAAAALALVLSMPGSAPDARKAAPDRLRLKPGQAWSIEDTLLTRITDPQTGVALTPSVKGVFRYHVDKSLADGSSVVAVKVVSLRGGTSMKTLAYLPVDHPERPEQSLLVTPEGRLFGPYPLAEKNRLASASSADDWLFARPGPPWVWYKLPEEPLGVGARVVRKFKEESWEIARLDDESIGGVDCAVYEAKLQADAMKVVETTWFDSGSGTVFKRELSEKRAKGVYSVLTQVRL